MKTIFVSGVFNIIHAGHICFLKEASGYGDKLIIAVPDKNTLWELYQIKTVLGDDDRIGVLKSLPMVFDALLCSDKKKGLEFRSVFKQISPDVFVMSDDDLYKEEKQNLCRETNTQCVILKKQAESNNRRSCTEMINWVKAPAFVPLRVDFAGGWLDMPQFSRKGGYIVNCAVSPTVSAQDWPYRKNAGLGGSGAWSVLNGWDPVESELKMGSGWQDPAVIAETGACVWLSGQYPVLDFKNTGDFLKGKMAILDLGYSHHTPHLSQNKRDYDLIESASRIARKGVMRKNIHILAEAVRLSQEAQLKEGMKPLMEIAGALAAKYCGGGFGGYALYLFESKQKREAALKEIRNLYPVEPYCRTFGKDEPVFWSRFYRNRLVKNGVIEG